MASVNKVILIGTLGRDPDVRTFNNGGSVANVSLATTEKWKDKQTNEQRESTEWHNVVFSNKLAEIVQKYLHKGAQIYIEGSLHTEKYTDKNGVEKSATKIRADVLQMLGGKPSASDSGNSGNTYNRQVPQSNQQQPKQQPASTQEPPAYNNDDWDGDVPF